MCLFWRNIDFSQFMYLYIISTSFQIIFAGSIKFGFIYLQPIYCS